MPLKTLLKMFGLPTELQNGHEIGCQCGECHEYRKQRDAEIRDRIRSGAPAQTLGEIILEEQKRAEAAKRPN